MQSPTVGAGDVTRTHDLLITNQLHYRLCYTSDPNIIIYKRMFVKYFNKNKEPFDSFFYNSSTETTPSRFAIVLSILS